MITMSSKGIDVSYANGTIDWSRVKGNVDFAIIRSSFGSDLPSQIDNYFYQNTAGCEKYGIPYGIYHFAYFVDEKTAKDEADFAVRLAKECKSVRFIALDIEEDSARYAKRVGRNPNWTSCAVAFLERVKAAGFVPVLYTNQSWMTTIFNYEKLRQYVLWYAAPGASAPRYSPAVWQYSWNGSVPGISGDVDMDICYDDTLFSGKAAKQEISQINSAMSVDKYVTVTSTNGVNIRSGAGTSYDILGAVPYNITVRVTLQTSGGGHIWGLTTYNGVRGWIALDYTKEILSNTSAESVAEAFPKGTIVKLKDNKDLRFVVLSSEGKAVKITPVDGQKITVNGELLTVVK